jgi:HNH endonuclease
MSFSFDSESQRRRALLRYGDPVERFWKQVRKSSGNGCWLWTGCTDHRKPHPYGRMRWKGRQIKAHRIAWILTYGEIPDGLWVLHKCDVPLCVRPDHLFLGTNLDNVRDSIAKGRWVIPKHHLVGEAHYNAKLTDDDVLLARQMFRDGVSQRQIARTLDIAFQQIWRIVHGKSWKHLV